jgi:hypothetical protein
MNHSISRRSFLGATTTMAGLRRLVVMGPGHRAAEPQLRTASHKGSYHQRADRGRFRRLGRRLQRREAGVLPLDKAEKCRAAGQERDADSLGHPRLGGVQQPGRQQGRGDVRVTEDALRAGQIFGADAVLLVPCRIGGMKIPLPWEFEIAFDDATGHLRQVVVGDNALSATHLPRTTTCIDTSESRSSG